MKKTAATIVGFAICAIAIGIYATLPPANSDPQTERQRLRVVAPGAEDILGYGNGGNGHPLSENGYMYLMEPGETVISTLSLNIFSAIEDQAVAFRPSDGRGPIYIAFFTIDEDSGSHVRLWSMPTSATIPSTVSLFSTDLLGDRGSAIILTGMNDRGEHTMTALRRSPFDSDGRPFEVIADIRIDGYVSVREIERSLAYQQGLARGEPFEIVASGQDPYSDNMLDRIERTYAFDASAGIFLRSGEARIPGARIEQNQVQRILSGAPGVFENFLGDLWYHVAPDGTIDRDQFIFFDPVRREIVFFGEESQQIFSWEHSTFMRQGILIASHNSAISSMRRRVNVELESLDSIRVTVTDERRQRVGIPPPWSGLYRRARVV